MFLVQCEEFKINHLTLGNSCSDNTLRLLVLVVGKIYWGLHVTSSFSIWGCILKGCFERGIFWRAKSRLKGIEDFNLEHWRGAPRIGTNRHITIKHDRILSLVFWRHLYAKRGLHALWEQTHSWCLNVNRIPLWFWGLFAMDKDNNKQNMSVHDEDKWKSSKTSTRV
jgi:hypothetical protein